jgi:carbon storage regulator
MLVLARNISESIKIADGAITVTVLAVNGTQVRLGVDAPREISVHRTEVYLRIQKGGDSAS